ncbi:MAG: CBS domain-containing protein, partial [Candidatus Bathyarchaeia archaeon]
MAGIVLVRDIMSKNVRVVRPDSSAKEVVATMNKFDIGSVVVVQGGRPVGIITERDILKRIVEPCLAPETLSARQIMTSPVVTIDASINEAAKLMAKKGIKRLLVTRNNDELVGIITFTDIVTKVP